RARWLRETRPIDTVSIFARAITLRNQSTDGGLIWPLEGLIWLLEDMDIEVTAHGFNNNNVTADAIGAAEGGQAQRALRRDRGGPRYRHSRPRNSARVDEELRSWRLRRLCRGDRGRTDCH